MDFRILGPLDVGVDGRSLPLGGAKRRAVLALLILSANETVSSDRLIDDLWGEDPPARAANALQVHISGLRKLLATNDADGLGAGRLETKPPGYVLRVDAEELDLHRFETLRDEARAELARGEVATASAKLRAALALWRGPPLDDLAFEPALQIATTRLEELRLSAVETRIEADLARGLHSDLVGELEALVSANPLREGLRAHLMLALYRSGRQAESLEIYRQTRQTLVDQLGIEPSPHLAELHQAILGHDPALELVPVVDARSADTPIRSFVGRESELEQLLVQLEAARTGRASIALIAGDAGIGKTRLADELGTLAAGRGFAVHWGRCWEAGGAPPYWPWLQALRSYLRDADDAALRAQLSKSGEVAELLPELQELQPGASTRPALGQGESDRFRTFESVVSLMRSAALVQPQLLILDDLHVADAGSLLMLQFLARERATEGLLVVGTYRDGDLDAAGTARSVLLQVSREPGTMAMALEGLGSDDVARYLEATTRAAPADAFVAALHERTEGNPLFVGEMVRLLGTRTASPGDVAPAGLLVPETVTDVIAQRLERLSGAAIETLTTASVIGRSFATAVLGRVTGRVVTELVEVLDEAVAARVVSRDPDVRTRYRFSHVLVRETLYERLSSGARLRLHHAVAEALEAMYGDQPEHFSEIAHHYLAAAEFADASKAVLYARRAGDRALGMFAFEEAARNYGDALSALDAAGSQSPEDRCALLLALATAHARGAAEDEAKRAFWTAAEIAAEAGLADALARAALGYGGRFLWGRASMDERLVPLLERALAAIGATNARLRIMLMGRLAGATRAGSLPPGTPLELADGSKARAIGREAVGLARELGDAETLAYALEASMHTLVGPDSTKDVMAHAREIVALAEQIGDRERAFAGHENLFHAAWQVGDTTTAIPELAALAHLAETLRQPAQLWMLHALRAKVALAQARFDDAEREVVAAHDYGRAAQGWNAEITYRLQSFMLRRGQGRLAEAEPGLRQAVAQRPGYPLLRCALANLHVNTGRDADARAEFTALAPDDFRAVPRDETWLVSITLLAETCAALGEERAAAVLYGLLSPYKDLVASVPPDLSLGSVARPLGLLASTLGDAAAADAHFRDAIEIDTRLGARAALAETQAACGAAVRTV